MRDVEDRQDLLNNFQWIVSIFSYVNCSCPRRRNGTPLNEVATRWNGCLNRSSHFWQIYGREIEEFFFQLPTLFQDD